MIYPTPPDDHTTTYATYASSVTWWKRSTRTLTSPPPPWRSYDNICNICLFRNVMEALDTNVNIPPPPPHPPTTPTPLTIIRQHMRNICLFHVQHVKKSKMSNPIPPFRKTSFLKFATLPRDRKWHISKSTTLPRAPYQPHAKNNILCGLVFVAMFF